MSAIAAIQMNHMTDSTTSILALTGVTSSATIGANRTYSPAGFRLPGVARWVERTAYTVPAGQPSFELSVRQPINGSRNYRVTATYSFPTLKTSGGYDVNGFSPAPEIAYTGSARLEIVIPERSAYWERVALFNMILSSLMTNILASDGAPNDATGSPLPNAVLNLDPPYGG